MQEKRRGRSTSFTPEIADKILTSITNGSPIRFAALSAGVDDSTVYKWMKQGKNGDPENPKDAIFIDFFKAMKVAKGKWVEARIAKITYAANQAWQANAWLLERMYPEQFGSDRREIRDLKKMLAELMSEVAAVRANRAQLAAADTADEARTVRVEEGTDPI